jgi:hypothetical protein
VYAASRESVERRETKFPIDVNHRLDVRSADQKISRRSFTMTTYEFSVRKSRDPKMSYAPYYVTAVSSDRPRLEGILVAGLEYEEEAKAVCADLEAIVLADSLRDAAQITSVELPEPNRVVPIDSLGRRVHDHPRQRNGKWRTIRRGDVR